MRLKFNVNGFRALRTDPKVQAEIRRRAERVAAAAGPGVEVLPIATPRNRARALVGPVTSEAARRVAKDNSLIRALEAGKGL